MSKNLTPRKGGVFTHSVFAIQYALDTAKVVGDAVNGEG